MTRDYRARQKDRAIYLVAGQDAYQELVGRPVEKVRGGKLPGFLRSLADLDFLDPNNPFFHTDRALFSGGPVLRGENIQQGMFSPRPGTTILGDSGGFQLIDRPDLFEGDPTRELMLRWLETNADEAMTLDIPTEAIRPNSQFDSFERALEITVENLRYFDRNRTPGAVRFLNVMQGRDRTEALRWYDAVGTFQFEGFAFGGAMHANVLHLVDMLTRMHNDGILDKTRNRVHILGRATLQLSVLLSAIQRGLRARTGDEEFQITFDTSGPSSNMMRGTVHGYPVVSPSEFKLSKFKAPSTYTLGGSSLAFPIKSSEISGT